MPAMCVWTAEQIDRIGSSQELELASRRPGGGLGTYVTMWVVRVGEDLYVRSAGGPDRPWYQRARAVGEGHIRAGGIDHDVDFGSAPPDVHEWIDDAYHAKYDRYGPTPVGHVTGPQAEAVTIRLVPRTDENRTDRT